MRALIKAQNDKDRAGRSADDAGSPPAATLILLRPGATASKS